MSAGNEEKGLVGIQSARLSDGESQKSDKQESKQQCFWKIGLMAVGWQAPRLVVAVTLGSGRDGNRPGKRGLVGYGRGPIAGVGQKTTDL